MRPSDAKDGAVRRFDAADASVILERLSGSGLVARGAVNLISVEAIRERSGARWPRRRDDVWAYVERKLDEHLSLQDLRQRVGETDFLIALTADEGVAAQAIALRILEEVLLHFLGEALPGDLDIRKVSQIVGSELTAELLDPQTIQTTRTSEVMAVHRAAIDPALERERNPVILTTASGQQMRIDFAVERVISLKHDVTAALRIEPAVRLEATNQMVRVSSFERLSDVDLHAIDEATVAFARLYAPSASTSQMPLIVPISFRTVGARKGRALLASQDAIDYARVKAWIMIELVGVVRGTPPGRLVEVAGLVASITRGVMTRLHPGRDATAPVRDCRLQGLTLDLQDLPPGSNPESVLRDVAAQARGLSPSLIAQGLPDPSLRLAALQAGFTHAAMRGPPTSNRPAAQPTADLAPDGARIVDVGVARR